MAPNISSPTLYYLRSLQQSDAACILQGRNSEHVRSYMLSDHIISPQEHQRWIEKKLSDREQPYFVFLKQDKPIGLVGLSHLEKQDNRGEWGFYIWDKDTPPGAGCIMLSAFLDYVFIQRQLRKLSAQVLASNSKSLHLHKKLGFHEEGMLKQHVIKQGLAHDVTLFALFDKDWQNKRADFAPSLACVAFLPTEE